MSTRDLILQNAKKERAALRAIATHARHLEPQVNARVAGDTLYINNEMYKYEDIDILPAKFSLASARTPRVTGNVVCFTSEHSPLSNFFPCQIQGQNWISIEQYFQYMKCQMTQNDRVADLIRKETDSLRIKRLGARVAIIGRGPWPPPPPIGRGPWPFIVQFRDQIKQTTYFL